MRRLFTAILLFWRFSMRAQEKHVIKESDYTNTTIEMADQFRAEGKIYVVVVIMSIILLGLLLYISTIDKKITALKKEILQKKK
ncbi:MAG: CcmD family protein [Cytophagales bacterium]|nr:CcmD family protein [Cytophagales bacterium]